jgi:glycogen(starch) synthase
MRVLIHSRVFLPSFGGLEKMMDLVATEVAAAGHTVTVVTMTPCERELPRNYRIVRSPSLGRLAREATKADVCLVANITLRTTPLLLLLGRKVVTTHQGWYKSSGQRGARSLLKNLLTYWTQNICCSEGVRRNIPGPSIVIPNSYASDVFYGHHGVPRDRDVVFVGRLVSDKGCDILIDAIKLLRDSGVPTTLTIVGAGEEMHRLETQCENLNLRDQVVFAGKLEGEELARMISRHRIMAVPSIWEEPFGIVALEGAACGCAIVGTDGGGLPEAIGPCGIVVKRGDPTALANGLRRLLTDQSFLRECVERAPSHLHRHTRVEIGARYLNALEDVAAGRRLVQPWLDGR